MVGSVIGAITAAANVVVADVNVVRLKHIASYFSIGMLNKWQIRSELAMEESNPSYKHNRRNLLLISFIAAIVFMGFFDFASTMLATNRVGVFDYETSAIIKAVYNTFGMTGFFVFKMAVIIVIAFILYRERLLYALWGMAASGLIISCSNMSVYFYYHSLRFFGIESLYYAVLVLAIGMLVSIFSMDSVKQEIAKIRCKLF